jgi:Rieske Fe-S protein
MAVPRVSGGLVDGRLVVPIGASSPLAVAGGVAITQVLARGIYHDVLLARLSGTEFSALNAICTHQGCVVSLVARPLFVCPCHGSRYDFAGNVVRGPAAAALLPLPVRLTDDVLTIDV